MKGVGRNDVGTMEPGTNVPRCASSWIDGSDDGTMEPGTNVPNVPKNVSKYGSFGASRVTTKSIVRYYGQHGR